MSSLPEARSNGVAHDVDVAVLCRGALDAVEAGHVLGVANALRSLGLRAGQRASGAGAPLALVFTPLADFEAALAPAGRARHTAVWPLLREVRELPAWAALAGRGTRLWLPSAALADRLGGAGAGAHWVGVCGQLGTWRYRSPAAFGLRDEDFVVVAVLDRRVGAATERALQQAWELRCQGAAARWAKLTLMVSVADDAQLAAWRSWARRGRVGSVAVERRAADPLALAALLGVADCEIVCEETTAAGLVPPWTTAAMLLQGKPVLALGGAAAGVAAPGGAAAGGAPPQLHRVPAGDPMALAQALDSALATDAPWRSAGAGAAAAPWAMLHYSARAVAARAVAALRAQGAWPTLAATAPRS